jgi:hypothetical protein
MRKDLGSSFFLVKIFKRDHCAGFGRHYFSYEDFRKSCGSEVCRPLSWGKYKNIYYAMYLERQNMYLIFRYDGWEGGMMKSSKGFKSDQQLFSKVYICVLFIFRFCCFAFQEWIPWFWGLQKIIAIHWIYKLNHKRVSSSSLKH